MMRRLRRPATFIGEHWPLLALVAVLTLAAIVISPKKPLWNDELYSWYFVTAESFEKLHRAFNEPINNTPFLYFGLGWLWAQLFGASELSLRLFSSLGISLAALAIWVLLRRTYGFWPAAIGLLGTFCTSELVLSQNAEARMYGLFLAVVGLAILLYDRLLRERGPSGTLLVLNAIAHAAIVHTHLFGLFYSAAIAGSFVAARLLRDGLDLHRLLAPLPVYLSFLAAWLSFLLYLPAFLVQSEAGRPYSWIPRPALEDVTALISHSSGAFVHSGILALLAVLAAVSTLLGSSTPEPDRPQRDHVGLLCLAVAFVALPVAVWLASRIGRPVFYDRYLMPSLLGWTILIGHLGARLLPRPAAARAPSPTRRWHLLGNTAVLFLLAIGLLAYPLIDARRHTGWILPGSEDVVFGHADLPVVVQTSHGFLERVHYAPAERYFYVLNWEATNTPLSGRLGIQQHKHMEAWRRAFPEVFAERILDSDEFLAAHEEFLVLTYDDYRRQCTVDVRGFRHAVLHCPQWVPASLLVDPDYRLTELGTHQGLAFLHVNRRSAP